MKIQIDGFNILDYILPWVGKTRKMAVHQLDQMLMNKDLKLTMQQWLVLNVIKSNQDLNQNCLAEFMNRDKTSVTRMINALEKKDYVSRIPSEQDARVNYLQVTKHGNRILEEAMPHVQEFLAFIQEDLSKTEIATTIKVLSKIQNKLIELPNSNCIS